MAALSVGGVVRVPGDKSISHRTLMLAALANGRSRIRGILESADVHSTAGVLRALGVEIPALGPDVVVTGRGLRGLRQAPGELDCGNSGTTTRLMAGICAAHPFVSHFVGDASLSRRPMRRVARPLEMMGARVELTGGERLPMAVHGAALRPIAWESEKASAQVKSAILLAGLVGGVRVTVREPERSRDHTERMLRASGATVQVGPDHSVVLDPPRSLAALDVQVPGDPSSAAFVAGLAALADRGAITIEGVGLNDTRTGFFDALRRMGANVRVDPAADQGGEPVGTITVSAGNTLRATKVAGPEVPSMIDELPLLACIAARARGTTEIRGASELRVKESDRITAVVDNLVALGVEASELPDGLLVTGSDRPLRGKVVTHGDHRLAMAFGVLGALPGNDIAIDDRECAIVSFPGFWRLLESLATRVD
ncbi:MAG TPA: 3-phosphoshikimate 1-carboxyvinyltransferase [Gemmatimonadaceae bacterium]